jgi:hypothetical protein
MKDRKDFELSDTNRIKFVRDSLAIWMKNNAIELFEVKRGIAMLLREQDDERKTRAMK